MSMFKKIPSPLEGEGGAPRAAHAFGAPGEGKSRARMATVLCLAAPFALLAGAGFAADAPKFGKPVTEADARAWDYWPYATMVFDYIRRAMPDAQPKSLSNDEVYAAVAYILNINGIIKDADVMNKDTIMKVQMPNRDGFVDLYPGKF